MTFVDFKEKFSNLFDFSDFFVFALMITICLAIGLYFGCKKKPATAQPNDSEAQIYLLGGQDLTIFPVAMSLCASALGGTIIVGTSTEIYMYGSQFVFMLLSTVICGVVMHIFILPVYHELKIVSVYEYLDKRFNRSLRLLGSILYIFSTVRNILCI